MSRKQWGHGFHAGKRAAEREQRKSTTFQTPERAIPEWVGKYWIWLRGEIVDCWDGFVPFSIMLREIMPLDIYRMDGELEKGQEYLMFAEWNARKNLSLAWPDGPLRHEPYVFPYIPCAEVLLDIGAEAKGTPDAPHWGYGFFYKMDNNGTCLAATPGPMIRTDPTSMPDTRGPRSPFDFSPGCWGPRDLKKIFLETPDRVIRNNEIELPGGTYCGRLS